MPKQFVRLFDDRSLFMMSCERNSPLCESTLVVSNEQQYFLALDQLEALGARGVKFLLEPVGRNTAPAIALACLSLKAEEIVFVTPSDHLIRDEAAYKNSVLRARELAKQGFLVTFGIKPAEANTGYGYIEASGEDVLKFHEKPELAAAQSYIAAGNFYWNSGMFMFKAGVFLSELKAQSFEIYEACVRAHENSNERETLKAAKKQGIISCRLMLATVAVSFFAKLYLIFTQPHGESQEQLIKLLEGSVNFVLFLAAAIYMWYALKKLEEIYDADVLSIYKQMIFVSIVFAVVGIAFGFIRGIEDRPATAGTGLAGLFILAIAVYLAVLWAKLNFSLAKITENNLFKTYVFFAIASFIIAFALQIMLSMGYFTAVFSILLAALVIVILYVLPTAFYLYAWTMIKEE